MLNAILLLCVVIGLTIQSVTRKSYSARCNGGAFTFSTASTLFALLVFFITSNGKLEFCICVIPYAILFAISYVAAIVFAFLSIKEGSLSLSSLIIQYSLIVPTVFGFAMWGEPFTVGVTIGIALLVVSLALINYNGKTENKTVTPKWLFFVAIAFLGNGICSTVQKAQQMSSGGLYKNEFMILALAISFMATAVIAIVTERADMKRNIKHGVLTYSACGIANGLVNFLVLILSARMDASVMFPLISAGGIVATYLVSLFVYKEKMTTQQTIGMFVGIGSIIALNL